MVMEGTVSVGQVLEMLGTGHQSKTTGRYRILARDELVDATPLMTVSNGDAICSLLPSTTLELLGFQPQTLRQTTPESIWRAGVQTGIFTNANGGIICVCRDGYALQVFGFLHGSKAFEVGIRDRRLDGNGNAGLQSALNNFPVHHEQANGVCAGIAVAELSVYSTQPSSYLEPGALRDFIANPDSFIYPWSTFNARQFFALWQQALASGLAPWQPSPPIRGLGKHFVEQAEVLLTALGYHQVETVPAWFNVAKFFHNVNGYKFVNPSHRDNFRALEVRLSELSERLSCSEEARRDIPYGEEAWYVALQNIPPMILRDVNSPYYADFGRLYLDGYVFTNSPSSTDYCARLTKALNAYQWPT
jgi:hypothetical protein